MKSSQEHSAGNKPKGSDGEIEYAKELLESERRHWKNKGKDEKWIAAHLEREAAKLDPKPSTEESAKRAAEFASIRNAVTTAGQS